jgi:hypothetical protein
MRLPLARTSLTRGAALPEIETLFGDSLLIWPVSRILWILFPEMTDRRRLRMVNKAFSHLESSGTGVGVCVFSQTQQDAFDGVPVHQVDGDGSSLSDASVARIESEFSFSARRQALPEISQWVASPSVPQPLLESGMRRLAEYVTEMDRIVSRHDYDTVVIAIGPSIAFRAGFLVAAAGNATPLMLFPSPLSENHQFGFTNQMTAVDDFVGLPASDELTEGEITQAREFIDATLESQRVPGSSDSAVAVSDVIEYTRDVVLGSHKFRSRRDVVIHSISERFRTAYNNRFGYSEFDPSERYVFLPLHHPFDSQLTLRGLPWRRQESAVEQLSVNLPSDRLVYVKEHPHSIGEYDGQLYRVVDNLSNVRLIPPSVNPHLIIENADAVTPINSTSGMESIMHGVPVLALGDPYYTFSSGVRTVKNPRNLERDLRNVLQGSVDDGDGERFIARLLNAEFEIPYHTEDPANAEQFADGLSTLLNRVEDG